ncbi:MAG TPA: GDSL-type esterase/lipase family protein [Jatrophihabitans sp.]
MIVRSAAATAALTALALAGCTASHPGDPGPSTPSAPSANTPVTSTPAPSRTSSDPAPSGNLYVAIGDSYAAGFQATGRGTGHPTHHGYADQLVGLAARKGYHLRLVNFGCSGATTSSVLHSPGCASHYPALGGPSYRVAQADAAVAYLKAHAGRVALVTVSLGGNDVTPCSADVQAVGCLTTALRGAARNIGRLLARIRAAAPRAVVVGTGYPDIFLGKAVSSDPTEQQLARISVFGFRQFVNPTLQQAYARAGAAFVDVTAATGGYLPLRRTTTVAPYGRIPVAVANVCRLTYYCQYGDIHPRTTGYAIIAGLVLGRLPRR